MKYRGLFTVNGLSLDRLHALVSVDDAGSIAAAAPTDRNRQGQMCRQIGELEKFFDTSLKRKEGRTAHLTVEGKSLARLAREHLQSLDEFKRDVKQRPLNVSLAAGGALHEWVILPRMAKLRETTSAVIWQLHTRKNAVMLQQLLDGSLDLGLLRSDLLEEYKGKNGKKKSEANEKLMIEGVGLGSINYSVFVPDRISPRAADLPLKKILGELPIATQGDDTKFQLGLEFALAKRRWTLNAAFYGESFTQVAKMVATEVMAGILPNIAADAFDPARVWRAPLKDFAELRREISLAWNPARHDRLSTLQNLRPMVERVLRFEG